MAGFAGIIKIGGGKQSQNQKAKEIPLSTMLLEDEGKNPFTLESKEPDGTIQDFIMGEIRFSSLEGTFPEESKRLRAQIEEDINRRYRILKQMNDAEF